MQYNEVGGVFGDNEPEKVEITFSKVDDTFLDKFNKFLERAESRRERYDLTWNGKAAAFAEAGKPLEPAKTLRPDLDESVDFDKTQNLFITGDNLEALKLLQESYLNKVDMIYIDPPYNTGHDFIYHDNFHRLQSDEIDDSRDDDGNRQYTVNSKENGRYHSDWLSMMYPRLMIARNLLSENGVIFISIDDSEQANLKLLCDEVFGVDNFVNQFMWLHGKGKKDSWSRTSQQYLLAYAKDKQKLNSWVDIQMAQGNFSNPDNDPRGPWFSGSISFDEKRSNKSRDTYFTITSPSGIAWTRQWQVESKEEMDRLLNDNRIYFGPAPSYSNVPRRKIFPNDENEIIPSNLLNDCGSTRGAQKYLDDLMGANAFNNPKPVELIAKILRITRLNNSTVLDFFAGSGTTADAVMQLNAEDGGHRRFIMVQLPEECGEKSEAYKAGYKTIDQLSRERIRRAAKKIKESDKNADDHDYGFRALYIDKANAKDDISVPADSLQQSQLSFQVDDIYADRSPLDLLFGVLVAKGWQLDGEIERRNINGNDVYLYDYVPGAGMVACFDNELTNEAVSQIIDMHSQVAVFRETAFKQSDEKINLMERFKNDSSETRVWVI